MVVVFLKRLSSFPIWESALFDVSCKTTALIQGTGLLYLCAKDALKQGLVYLLETKLLSMYGKCKGVVKCYPLYNFR